MKRSQLSILGLIILFVGVFLPAIKLPLYGSLNYFQNGAGDGVILLIFAVAALVLICKKDYDSLIFPGFGALIFLLVTLGLIVTGHYPVKLQFASDSAARLVQQSLQIDWGWAILMVGALLLITAAFMKPEKTE